MGVDTDLIVGLMTDRLNSQGVMGGLREDLKKMGVDEN
jgi:hypothetical protein